MPGGLRDVLVAAAVAHEAALFLVDHRDQFLANRDAGNFDGYPDPAMMLGEALIDGVRRPAAGRVVVTHLGVGLSDVVFGNAILAEAERRGLGTCCRDEPATSSSSGAA